MKKISVKMLCQMAMLIALEIVLERFCSISTATIRIGFAFIPMALCGMLFGPVWGGVAYGIADLIGAAIFTGIFPGITVARICSGVIYGLFLHRENVKFAPHMLSAALCDQIICTLGITTLVLSVSSGTPFSVMLWTRLPQAVVCAAMEIAVFPLLVKLRQMLKLAGLVEAN